MNAIYERLMEHMQDHPIINTHSHSLPTVDGSDMTLDTMLHSTYMGWKAINAEGYGDDKDAFVKDMRFNSYFTYFQKSLQELYGLNEPISKKTWQLYSDKIHEAYQDKLHRTNILREKCRYEKVIVDSYWNPGEIQGFGGMMTAAYRINMYLFGYSKTAVDHKGKNPFQVYGWPDAPTIDDYVALMRRQIGLKLDEDCVAIKAGCAYDRGLDFMPTTKYEAAKAYMNPDATPEEIKAFQDYIFDQICKYAAERDVPVQCHTGLARLNKSNAMWLKPIIDQNPDTRFVIFHGSYPWMDDVLALVHNYPNVYPDLCWMPILSPSATERFLEELLELGNASKICWGCDTWMAEDSFGALLAARHVFAKLLSRKVEEGFMNEEEAKALISDILYNNAKKIYKF